MHKKITGYECSCGIRTEISSKSVFTVKIWNWLMHTMKRIPSWFSNLPRTRRKSKQKSWRPKYSPTLQFISFFFLSRIASANVEVVIKNSTNIVWPLLASLPLVPSSEWAGDSVNFWVSFSLKYSSYIMKRHSSFFEHKKVCVKKLHSD